MADARWAAAVPPPPSPNAYWVIPARFLASEYPGGGEPEETRARLRRYLDAGVSLFLDLTEPSEYGLPPYDEVLRAEASGRPRPIVYQRLAIPDMGVPSEALMREILSVIEWALASGHVVCVHCYGGIGRTGTAVGCFLVRRGWKGEEALAEIPVLRRAVLDVWAPSPQTESQRQFVRAWVEPR